MAKSKHYFGLKQSLDVYKRQVGGSSSSNNIGPLDLINIRRIAWGVRDKQSLPGYTNSTTVQISDDFLEALTEKILKKLI